MKYVGIFAVAALVLTSAFTKAEAAGGRGNSNNTPADIIHPNIHQNNGPGNNANPNGANAGGGNMHGIANNPGQSGINPNDDGVPGFRNELNTVHGGILDVTGGNARGKTRGNSRGKAKSNRGKRGGKPEKILVCKYSDEVEVDDAGDVIFDDLGNVNIITTTELVNVPSHVAAKFFERDSRNFDYGNSEDDVQKALCEGALEVDDNDAAE